MLILCHVLNYLIRSIHFHSLYIMSYYYAKFKENSCVGTDASTPLKTPIKIVKYQFLAVTCDFQQCGILTSVGLD